MTDMGNRWNALAVITTALYAGTDCVKHAEVGHEDVAGPPGHHIRVHRIEHVEGDDP